MFSKEIVNFLRGFVPTFTFFSQLLNDCIVYCVYSLSLRMLTVGQESGARRLPDRPMCNCNVSLLQNFFSVLVLESSSGEIEPFPKGLPPFS